MKELTKVEETIMIAIWRLKEDAYGVTIKRQIKNATGRDYLYNTLYTSLEQLVRKGFIMKRYGEPEPIRGGKRKIFFNLTKPGITALKDAFEKQKTVWQGISEESFNSGLIDGK